MACGIFGVAQSRAGITVLINKQPKWSQGDLDSSPGSAAGLQSDDTRALSLSWSSTPLFPAPLSMQVVRREQVALNSAMYLADPGSQGAPFVAARIS